MSQRMAMKFSPNEKKKLIYPKQIKHRWQTAKSELDKRFWLGDDIQALLKAQSFLIDEILLSAWKLVGLENNPNIALIAVGGYGCERLHPHSDVDILLLTSNTWDKSDNPSLEKFISFCWDCQLTLGASVRTLDECETISTEDLSIYTNLLNARRLVGSQALFEKMNEFILRDEVWPFKTFFEAKCKERENRLKHYQNTEYNLEPNIKDSPGGLRDIDLISWLTLKKYHQSDLKILISYRDLFQEEYEILMTGRAFLWKMRYGLHLIVPKTNERLYFEYQETLAKKFHFDAQNQSVNTAISKMMQEYFHTVTQIREITDVLCQHFKENLKLPSQAKIEKVNSFCQIIDDYLDITSGDALQTSENLMQLFFIIAQRNLEGFSANAHRLIISALNKAGNDYFNHPQTRALFLNILRSKNAAKVLFLMHRLNVLERYIPAFGDITGQMQFDLFHIYTVDAHALLVLDNIEHFFKNETFDKFELLKQCKEHASSIEILYLGALFHDIGKGKGGDHSQVGSDIALAFCQAHQIPRKTTELITWLVENHLLMSITSQRKDISDEEVIRDFASSVNSLSKLCYLYLLTVADIVATNPSLWNNWRAILLQDLFKACAFYLQNDKNLSPSFLSIEQTKWQTQMILEDKAKNKLFTIAIKEHVNHVGTDIFIYAPDSVNLFACICATLEKIFLNVVEARINTTKNNYSLQSFVVLDISGIPVANLQRMNEIHHSLNMLLTPLMLGGELKVPVVSRHIKRSLKYFSGTANVTVTTLQNSTKTLLEVHAPDFPGLLARIGEAFVKADVILHSAKINTLGNKVEDLFYITDRKTLLPLTDPTRIEQLKSLIEQSIAKHCK